MNFFHALFWMFLSHYAEIIWTGSCLKLNNGDNQRKAYFLCSELNILLTVTIVEVHTSDICVSLHEPIQIISA